MAIGIFGGTFNPPHLGHKKLLAAFADRFCLDRVLVIPTFVPPHKAAPDLADAALRLTMCRILFDDPRVTVSDMEICRGGRSYTVETLRALHDMYPQEKLYFLVGSDMLRTFDSWYRPDEIRSLCTLCAAVRRHGETLPDVGAEVLEAFDPVELSSTDVRNAVRTGADVTGMVGAALAAFIAEHGLYTDDNTAYCRRLREKLGPYRLRHSFAVADSARELAERFGGDPDKAYRAGLLHDIMKDTPKPEMLLFMEKAGVSLTSSELYNPKLWHAIAGEAYLRDVLSIDDGELLSAVRYHTTGREGMSLLERIIYIADYISADRTYRGIVKMRALAKKSLEEAMLFGLSFTISDLARKGQLIHPDSVACYNEICLELKQKGNL